MREAPEPPPGTAATGWLAAAPATPEPVVPSLLTVSVVLCSLRTVAGVGVVVVLGGLDLGGVEGGRHLGHDGAAAHGRLEQVGDSLLEPGLDVALLFGLLGRGG